MTMQKTSQQGRRAGKTVAVLGSLAMMGAFAIGSETAANGLDDLEIAHAAYTAGSLDIRYAYLALALSETPAVQTFAQTMIRDHSAVNEAAVALLQELDAEPRDNELSQSLVAQAAAKRDELRRLKGQSFDCAYALNELAYHQLVNATVEETLIPNVAVPKFKALLEEALVTFKVHEGHAEHMVAELGCDS